MEEIRRTAWEDNLIRIYEHNLMAAAGHHGFILRDNQIADLDTAAYINNLVHLFSYNCLS
jgi:hypothetical protein